MQLTPHIHIQHETHVVIPLDQPPAPNDTTFLSIVALSVTCVTYPQWVIWPFPNPNHQYSAFQYKLLRPDQTSHILKTVSLINTIFHHPQVHAPSTAPEWDQFIVASFEELVLKIPFETIVDLYATADTQLCKKYQHNYGFVVLAVPVSAEPQEVQLGWRWKGPLPFIGTSWLGDQAPARTLCIFNAQRLQWQEAQCNDSGPANQHPCTNPAVLQGLFAVEGKAAPFSGAVYARIMQYRSTDVIASPNPITVSLAGTRPKDPVCILS